MPGWSDTLVGSSTKTLSSTRALTSYHLLSLPKNSCGEGTLAYCVPSFNKTLVTPKTFFSGKNISKNGLISFAVIVRLKTLVTPFTTVSLLTIV